MTDGWGRLGRRIRAERARQGYTSAAAFAQAVGIAARTVEMIEAGTHPGRPRDSTLARIDAALGWRVGSSERILNGGRPSEVADPTLERIHRVWHQLTGEQQIELAELAERLGRSTPPES